MMLQNAFLKQHAFELAALINQSTRDNDFDVFMRALIRSLGGYESASNRLGEKIVRYYWIERAQFSNDPPGLHHPRGHV